MEHGLRRLQLGVVQSCYLLSLSDTEVKHDFFTTTGNSIGSDFTVKTFNLFSLSSTGIGETTEDLSGFTSTEFESLSGLSLEQGNGSTKTKRLNLSGHGVDLIQGAFQPCVGGFYLTNHVSELVSNNRLVDQLLSEDHALVGILKCKEEKKIGMEKTFVTD